MLQVFTGSDSKEMVMGIGSPFSTELPQGAAGPGRTRVTMAVLRGEAHLAGRMCLGRQAPLLKIHVEARLQLFFFLMWCWSQSGLSCLSEGLKDPSLSSPGSARGCRMSCLLRGNVWCLVFVFSLQSSHILELRASRLKQV